MNAVYGDHIVSLVIAALNEEATIGLVIEQCRGYGDEVLVMDGHSTDGTCEIAVSRGARVVLDSGGGKGSALRESLDYVRGDILVFLDADGSHEASDIPKLLGPILRGEADHVSASRLMGGSSELHGGFDEFFRLTGSSFITACINKRFKVRLSDSQNGFRAIRADVMRNLELREDITTIEQEMIIKTLKKGYRLAEVPSHEYKRMAGKSKISLRSVWFRYGYSLIKNLL